MTDKKLTGLDDLRAWLVARGFRASSSEFGGRDNQCNWYAWRRSDIPSRACETNEQKTMQLVVKPFSFPPRMTQSVQWDSAELEVCGEAGGLWYSLKAYAMKPKEVMERIEETEARLMAAWNALLPTKTAE